MKSIYEGTFFKEHKQKKGDNLMEHHRLDPYPIPKDKTPLCINEPWLIDKSLLEYQPRREPDEKEDNVRIYVPRIYQGKYPSCAGRSSLHRWMYQITDFL